MTVRICHLWSDALNWNGSQGNLICLKKRLEWRGMDAEIIEISVSQPVDFSDFDLVYIGAGKAYENHTLLRDIVSRADSLQAYIAQGGVLLAVCEGYELLGNTVALTDGSICNGLGILNMKTVYDTARHTGNAVMDTAYGKVVYFENQQGLVYPEEELPPLGRMIKGHGNNGIDGLSGVCTGTIFACHAHGPLLPKNPFLADEILRVSLLKRNPDVPLVPLDDTLENQSRDEILRKVL